jgi:hypothetical protein
MNFSRALVVASVIAISLPADAAELRVMVQTSDGEAMPGITIRVSDLDRSEVSDSRGEARFDRMPRGRHVVVTSAAGWLDDVAEVCVGNDDVARVLAVISSTSTPARFTPSKGGERRAKVVSLRGTVVSPSGVPLGSNVELRRAGSSRVRRLKADARGHFVFGTLQFGRYEIHASSGEWVRSKAISLQWNGTNEMDIGTIQLLRVCKNETELRK